MPTVATVPTGGMSRPAWVNDVFAAWVYALDRRGIPFDQALPIARWITVLWWLESGEGTAEWNWNAGNVMCTGSPDPIGTPGWHGDCVRVGRGIQRAYASRVDAVADWLDLMESGHYRRSSWLYLVEHPEDGAGWYERLQADGYSARSAEGVRLLVTLAGHFTQVRGG